MTNLERLLALADQQAKLDMVATLRAPGLQLIGVIKARAEQLADPEFEAKQWHKRALETGW